MKTGDILELAEVVRNLSLRDREKGLSTGEKQMFVKAKKILASELMYAKEMDEEATAEWLDDVLAGASATNGTPKIKPSGSDAKTTARASAAAPSKASSNKAATAKAPAKKPPAKKATAGAR
jgi:CarD family transcriptional regulator